MEILLLGRDTSVTNTIKDMLKSVEVWSVTRSISIENVADQTSGEGCYDIIVANLADYAPPPTRIISKILNHFPSTYLLVLYSYSQKLLIQPLLEAGAKGYLQNGIPEDKLFEAVRTVANGNLYIGVEST